MRMVVPISCSTVRMGMLPILAASHGRLAIFGGPELICASALAVACTKWCSRLFLVWLCPGPV